MTARVLITGTRAPAALDLARSFMAAGFEVHLADSRAGRMARWAGVAHGLHCYASPTLRAEDFERDIAELTRRLQPVLIIPVCEEVFHLARAKEAGLLAGPLFAPTAKTLKRLHSKALFAELCEALALPVPETHQITSPADLSGFAGDAANWVFKAEYSRFGAAAMVGPTRQRLATLHPTKARPWVAQALIRGTEVCFYATAFEGRLTTFAAYGLPWRRAGGAAYAFSPLSQPLEARLQALATRLAETVGTGQFACDLIVDASGQPWLIECNPRTTSGVHLFGGEARFAEALLQSQAEALLGRCRGHIAPAMWCYGLPEALWRGQLPKWLAEQRQGQDVVSRRGGWRPGLGAILDSAAYWATALHLGCSLEQAMTYDIEWNGPGGGQ